MKILKTSIIPVLGISLAMLGTAHGKALSPAAVQEYANSGNLVVNFGTVGSLSSSTTYGLRFDGNNSKTSSGNIINNFGTIISGTGQGYNGGAGIFFDATNKGQSNGNTINNQGVIIGLSDNKGGASGILFDCSGNGDIKFNQVTNAGTIQVSGRGQGIGIGFSSLFAKSAINNTIVNLGIINVSSTQHDAFGIVFGGHDSGDSSSNLVINKGTISVTAPMGLAVGFRIDSSDSGVCNSNTIINEGSVIVSGEDAAGYYFAGQNEGSTSNNTIVNRSSIVVQSQLGMGIGVGFDGDSGTTTHNIIRNDGNIVVSGIRATGVYFYGSEDAGVNNNIVLNRGNIIVTANEEARGIWFNGEDNGGIANNNNNVANFGNLIVVGPNAFGFSFGSVDSSANNNVITNWGNIFVPGGTAISISGNGNVVNLNGHSSVTGLIAATGENNILNLAFTGVGSREAKRLRAQLGTALNGQPSSGTFVVRGVTYTYDPLIVALNVSSYEQQGRTPNQRAVGANLDSFAVNPTGDMLKLVNALDWSGDVPWGLEQLSPQRYQIYGDIALANANAMTQEIDQRLNNVRLGSESLDSSRLGVASSSIQSKLGMSDRKQVLTAATMRKDGKGVDLKETAPECNRWGAFISGDVIFADVDGRNQWEQDSKFTTAGLLAGVDAKITDSLTAGLLLGYSRADAELDNHNSNADVDTYSTGIYAGCREGNFYGNGMATYSRNNYESNRSIDFPGISRNADSSTSGSQYVVNIDGGYDHHVNDDVIAGPFAGLQYVNLGVDSFTEKGAGAANLAINDQGMDSLRSRLGFRLEIRKELACRWAVASEARLAWQHEFLNDDRAIVARFSGSGLGAFSVRTNEPERDAALVGLGINATYRDTLTTFADYDVQVGQSHYVEQIVKGGFKWSF